MTSNALVPMQAIANNPGAAMQFLEVIGEAAYKGGISGCKTPGQGKMIALTCLMEGMTPMEYERTYHLISGRPTMRADKMLAKFRLIGGKHKIVSRTPEKAEIELTLGGESHRFPFTMQEAKQEPFVYQKDGKTLKDNWATPRARTQMLWARVVSDGVRAMAPEVVAGMYTPEEVGDFGDGPVTPPHPVGEAATAETGEPIDAEFSVTGDDTPPFGDPKDNDARQDEPTPDTQSEDASPPQDAAQPGGVPAELKNELRDIVATNEQARGMAQTFLARANLDHPAQLDVTQAKQLLVELLSEKLGVHDKLPSALQKFGATHVTELYGTQCDQLLAGLRKKAVEQAAGN